EIGGEGGAFLVCAASLAIAPLSGQGPAAQTGRRQAAGATIGEVTRLVIGHPIIRDTTIMFAIFNVGDGALLVVLAHQARRAGFGPGGYGWLIAAMAVAELAAALALLRLRWRGPPAASPPAPHLPA